MTPTTIHAPRRRRIVAAEQVASAMRSGGAAEDKHLDELVEDDAAGDAWPVPAQRVGICVRRQQCGELVPDGLDDACWKRRHGGAPWSERVDNVLMVVALRAPVRILPLPPDWRKL